MNRERPVLPQNPFSAVVLSTETNRIEYKEHNNEYEFTTCYQLGRTRLYT